MVKYIVTIFFILTYVILLAYFLMNRLIKALDRSMHQEALTAKGREVFVQCYGRLYNKMKPEILKRKNLVADFDENLLFASICSALFSDSFKDEIIIQYKKQREAKHKIAKYEEYKKAHPDKEELKND